MPIYEYHCKACGRNLEIFQHMTDPSLTECPECQGKLRKVFSPVGIVFKGSGFYATDSKKSSAVVSPPAPTTSPEPASTPVEPAASTAAAPAPAKAEPPVAPAPAPASTPAAD